MDLIDDGDPSPIVTVLLPAVLGVFCPELNGDAGGCGKDEEEPPL